MKTTTKLILLGVLLSSLSLHPSAFGQGTAFTYQGQLSLATGPANGSYDLTFAVFNSLTGGAQQGSTITSTATAVSNGLFTVTLDFGNQFPGANRWLEISVRTNGGGSFTTLSPRQALTSVPYAVQAANAGVAASASSVSAVNITGTVGVAQLSTNVALRAGGNIFSGTQSNAGNLFLTGGGTFFTDNGPYFYAKNSAGVYEGYLVPRWVDNGMYMNFGDGGFFLRDNHNNYYLTVLTNQTITLGGPEIFPSSLGDKIALWGSPGAPNFGFGIAPALLQIHADVSASDIAFGYGQNTNFTETMRIKGSGNVGINTSSPGLNTLQINPGFEPANGYALEVNDPGYGYGANIQINRPSGTGGIGLVVDDIANGDASTSLFLVRNDSATNSQFLFDILANGNVGIGNTAPETPLQVGSYNNGDEYLTVSSAGGNQFRSGIKLRHFNSGYGWTLVSDEIDSSFRLLSHFNDTNGVTRLYVDRFSGDVGIGTTNPAAALDVAGEITCTAINITSDRNAKEDFQTVNPQEVLAKVTALPITEWQYKADKANNTESRHIGPMAQDFSAAFALNHDNKHISVVDEGGVALAAIQGLNEKVDERDARIHEQEIQVQTQAAEIRKLSQALADLQTAFGKMQQNVEKSKAE
jgi:hypothetical protein